MSCIVLCLLQSQTLGTNVEAVQQATEATSGQLSQLRELVTQAAARERGLLARLEALERAAADATKAGAAGQAPQPHPAVPALDVATVVLIARNAVLQDSIRGEVSLNVLSVQQHVGLVMGFAAGKSSEEHTCGGRGFVAAH